MVGLVFSHVDKRMLLDVLIDAVKAARESDERPTIIVDGNEYGDLLKVAGLLPDEELSEQHQQLVDQIFQKKQRGYRRTGYNLAHRANQIASSARMRDVYMSPRYQREQRVMLCSIKEKELFRNRGFSDRTINAITDCGIENPEKLLFMDEKALKRIPGVGPRSFAEIVAYRSRFGLAGKSDEK